MFKVQNGIFDIFSHVFLNFLLLTLNRWLFAGIFNAYNENSEELIFYQTFLFWIKGKTRSILRVPILFCLFICLFMYLKGCSFLIFWYFFCNLWQHQPKLRAEISKFVILEMIMWKIKPSKPNQRSYFNFKMYLTSWISVPKTQK